MKNAKRMMAMVVALFIVAAMLTGCGSTVTTGYEGKYVSIAGEMLGMTLSGDDIAGWAIELNAGGKGKMDVDGTKANIKWSLEGTTVTIKVQGEEMTAEIDGDTLVIDDVLGMGMKLTFAKEGSAAATDPSFALSDEEKLLVGTWQSDAVFDALDEDASGEIDPTAYTMVLAADKSAVVTYNGTVSDGQTWTWVSGMGSIDDMDITWDVNDDDTLQVTYFEGDDYYEFHCVKAA